MQQDNFPGSYVVRHLSGEFPADFRPAMGNRVQVSTDDEVSLHDPSQASGGAAPRPLGMQRVDRGELRHTWTETGGARYDMQISLYQNPQTGYKALYGIVVRLSAGGPGQDDPEAVGTWGADDDGSGGFLPDSR